MGSSFLLIAILPILCECVKGEALATDRKYQQFEPVCSLYLAESTIPNSGLGIFTTKDIPFDSEIHPSGDGPILTLHDIIDNIGNPYGDRALPGAYQDYVWTPNNIPEDHESNETFLSVPTIGSMINYHPMLSNVVPKIGSIDYDDSIVDRMTDPGAGAFSYHKSRNMTSDRYITAGEELFDDYGPQWFETTKRRDVYKDIARRKNYQVAHDIIYKFRLDNLDDNSLSVVNGIVKMFDKRTASVLPRTRLDYISVLKASDNSPPGKLPVTSSSISINLAKATLQHRSVNWLETNGHCLDNLVPRISTLSQAGYGAFAQRLIAEGTVVVPAPVLQIMNKKFLDIINRHDGNVINRQMLYNYCYGHNESTMLLCPMTRATLLNHCSERMDFGGSCGEGVGANAKLQWDSVHSKSKEWQQKSFEDIEKEVKHGNRGFSFDVIATRDIYPGEEVFIDYGEAWEEAWTDHIKSWRPPAKNSKHFSYMSVTKLTNDHDVRTLVEQIENPYADNVEVKCLYGELYYESENFELPPENWKEISYAEIIDEHSRPGAYHSIHSHEYSLFDYDWIYSPCEVFLYDDNLRLTVGIFAKTNDVPLIFTDYPSESIRFVSKPYTSDEHLPNSFRHPIGLPDDQFPEQWKNLKFK